MSIRDESDRRDRYWWRTAQDVWRKTDPGEQQHEYPMEPLVWLVGWVVLSAIDPRRHVVISHAYAQLCMQLARG